MQPLEPEEMAMAALLEFDLLRALQAPDDALFLPTSPPDRGPRRTILVAAWVLDSDNRLTCRWQQETSPPD